ncbi:MAG TPA: polyprenyl synthetase family protein [Balneolales bacterium]|nr:polyprenyl synthetase family protein [Balneolales bacterium]
MLNKVSTFSELIENRLQNIDIPGYPESLYKPVHYTLKLGGKRIRPNLVLLSCGMTGGDPEEALPAAIAIELLHNFTLIHDDIMDQADTRRGKESVYKKWDESTAILSGDVMFAYASRQLKYYGYSNKYSKEQFIRLYDLFNDAVITVCEGQALDLDFEKDTRISIEDYIKMISAKTAALLRCSFKMGAIVSNSGEEVVDMAGQIGSEAGIAFQIQDDLLDVIGDPEKFGKKTGGDIYEGKKTFLSILALNKANTEQRKFLTLTLQDKEKDTADVKKIIQLYEDLGVIEETKQTIERHYQLSLQYLHNFGQSNYRNDIEQLLQLLTNRDR